MTFSESNIRRDTEGKFSEKLGSAPELTLPAQTGHWTDPNSSQLLELPTDQEDAQDLYDLLIIWERRRRRNALKKDARHQLAVVWQHPRFPGPRFGGAGQNAAGLPWSPAARELLFSGESKSGRLRMEHVVPQAIHESRMFEAYENGEITDAESMLRHLRAEHLGPRFAVLTKEEDDLVTAAGYRSVLPPSGNPLDRYASLPDSVDDFSAPIDDERFPEVFAYQHRKWLRSQNASGS